MNLIATRVASTTCTPSHTVPIPPLPMTLSTRYLPATREPAREGVSLTEVDSDISATAKGSDRPQ